MGEAERASVAIEHGILSYRRLRGEWEGFLRLRVGDIRVIFRIDFEYKIIYIYLIHYRECLQIT